MPWEERCAMTERTRLVAAYLEGNREMAELCREFGISRKTGYKWLQRFRDEGPSGLEDRSRAPRTCPHAIPDDDVQALLELRRRRPTWGAKKLCAYLKREHPSGHWPAVSTAAAILKRHGLTAPRRRRSCTPPWTRPFIGVDQPNAVWSADFKGDFRLGNGQRCYPLTLTDNFSRYLLRCQALPQPTFELTWPIFEYAFREYGLPAAIRTDNGTPFAATSFTGLSRLSVRFLQLGIVPERIQVGHPEENGRHERMHRTLKAETCTPPAFSNSAQQLRFDTYLPDFNDVRPHEALGMATPGEHYQPSPRRMPDALPQPEYDSPYDVRKVSGVGVVYFRKHAVQVGTPLARHRVGLREVGEGLWVVRFAFMDLGVADLRGPPAYQRLAPLPPHLSWSSDDRLAAK